MELRHRNDLLGFSTPAETLASSTDDFLDFASAPTSMSTSPETEQNVVEPQQDGTSHDLLGFMSTAQEGMVATENHPASTATDLLDFTSVTESTTPLEDAESTAVVQASSPLPDSFPVVSAHNESASEPPPSEHAAAETLSHNVAADNNK